MVGAQACRRRTLAPTGGGTDTHGLASGVSALKMCRFWRFFGTFWGMASPSKPFLPAQAEGSMPEA